MSRNLKSPAVRNRRKGKNRIGRKRFESKAQRSFETTLRAVQREGSKQNKLFNSLMGIELPVIEVDDDSYYVELNNSISQKVRRLHEAQVAGTLSANGKMRKCSRCDKWLDRIEEYHKGSSKCKDCAILYYLNYRGLEILLQECCYCGDPVIRSPYCSESCRLSLEAIAIDFMPEYIRDKQLEPLKYEGVTPILVKYPNGRSVRVAYGSFNSEDWKDLDEFGIPKKAHSLKEYEGEVPVRVMTTRIQGEYSVWFRDGMGRWCPKCKLYKTKENFYLQYRGGRNPGKVLKRRNHLCNYCHNKKWNELRVSTAKSQRCLWCGFRKIERINDDFCSQRCYYIYMKVKNKMDVEYFEDTEKTLKNIIEEGRDKNQRLMEKYARVC